MCDAFASENFLKRECLCDILNLTKFWEDFNMAFSEMHIYSEALGLQTTVYVVIPQKSTGGEIGVTNNAKKDTNQTVSYTR